MSEFLGRARYQRAADCPDARVGANGTPEHGQDHRRAGTIQGEAARHDRAVLPRRSARASPGRCVESLVIAGFVRGLSRDVEATLADALGAEAALSKSTVSSVCRAMRGAGGVEPAAVG